VSVSRDELHLLTGAYAVDALPLSEADAFKRHLRRCAACLAEVRGLRETAARLAVATAIVSPPAMRARVLGAIASTRQEVPPGCHAAEAGARRTRPVPRLVRNRPAVSAALFTLAAAIIALGVFSGISQQQQQQLQRANARNQAIAAVLAAPDAHLMTAGTSMGGQLTAVVALREHRVVITGHGMPALTGARVYQLWLMAPGRATSAGLLAAGSARPVLASGLQPGDRIGLTVEPAGGTRQPTTTPIVVMPVRA
jgi:hypothetical protein